MCTPHSGHDRLPPDQGPRHEDQSRINPRLSIADERFRRIAAMLQEPAADAAAPQPGLRFDRSQPAPPRPHLALSAHRVWTEILNSAARDDADTSLIHDLANLHPQVSSTILRAVNAAQGGVIRPVQEVGLAIELLGLRRLRTLAAEQQERTSRPELTQRAVGS